VAPPDEGSSPDDAAAPPAPVTPSQVQAGTSKTTSPPGVFSNSATVFVTQIQLEI
jgi:hypothetical protein